MSATMFSTRTDNLDVDHSRIPVRSPSSASTSPFPIRRSLSLRLRGEKASQQRATTPAPPPSRHRRPHDDNVKSSRPLDDTSGLNGGCDLKTDHRATSTPRGCSGPRAKNLSLSISGAAKSPTFSLPSTTPPASPYENSHHQWDNESVDSNFSLSSCDHAAIARNGTTFSGRSMKYIFHCNQNTTTSSDEYLTPTQRAHRQIKKLKCLLHQAQLELGQKDSEILKLTKEVVELRLYKAAIRSPDEKSNSSDAVTVKENNSSSPSSEEEPPKPTIPQDCSDSGHFEDDALASHCDKSVETTSERELVAEYEKRIRELIAAHEEESVLIRRRHNDKIEELLARIGDINHRYWQIVPELEAARERIRDLEKRLEDSCKKLEELDTKREETRLELTTPPQLGLARSVASRLSVNDLLEELQVTKNELDNLRAMYKQLMEAKSKSKIDPEVTLQFLKSAIYYFLTDKENTAGHLRAIQSILGFNQTEITNIDKAQLQ